MIKAKTSQRGNAVKSLNITVLKLRQDQEKDWIDLKLDIAEEKDTSFFASAGSKVNL